MRFTSLRARAATLAIAGLCVGASAVTVPAASGSSNTTISQSGNNTNIGIAAGNVGVTHCQGTTNICPVVNGNADVDQKQHAGHKATVKNKSSKKSKKHDDD